PARAPWASTEPRRRRRGSVVDDSVINVASRLQRSPDVAVGDRHFSRPTIFPSFLLQRSPDVAVGDRRTDDDVAAPDRAASTEPRRRRRGSSPRSWTWTWARWSFNGAPTSPSGIGARENPPRGAWARFNGAPTSPSGIGSSAASSGWRTCGFNGAPTSPS